MRRPVEPTAAFYRKTAAELVQRYPELVEHLRTGQLCITSVVELAKIITPENRREVVARFLGTSKREAREVVAELRPATDPPQREVVTAVRAPAEAQPLVPVQPANLLIGPSQRPAGAVQPAVTVTRPAAPDPAHGATATPAV